MSLMFLRSSCVRSSPLSWFSRASSNTMPLRTKVVNSAFAGQARMATTAAEIPRELPGDEPDDVVFNNLYGIRSIELNRPRKLNSLNGSMARKIIPRLKEWEKSQLANIIMISGVGEKAFCAGGDVATLASQNTQGKEGQQKSKDFFSLEYKLDHLIATYSKPYIAILDGITMGGGVGLSVHAPFRIATEKTVFAMPETTIGFFPDVGGSFFLPRLDGEIGTYLALTSERLVGVQAFYSGIATHYLHSSSLSNLTARLSELVFKDYAPLKERLALINRTISEFSTGLPDEKILLGGSLRESIDRCFSKPTVEEIIVALEAETDNKEWAQKTVETLKARSPTALKVTLRQLRVGRTWSIAETFQREEKIAGRFMEHPDFVEGVTARLINKPPTKPNWKPATLEEVTEKDVDEFFRIQPGEQRLPLLNPEGDYKEYPHSIFTLPSEASIREYVRQSAASKTKTIKEFENRHAGKDGVSTKVSEVLDRKTKAIANGGREWVDEA
ncbi:3-hydroxyisobutyryl-CoA hydrolase [Coccidioides immitis H538.4]|nr:3-hydroxyisobutyryl-CoA hydrolase [Coccidioides immitis RMSCC 2394]KMU82009.1 3-hydroxyisobutyryl-CoA hydrolase [Coccidioides immitis RMSCC 3703]KMU89124.1 3-hydroxyisobutyryl-CoA hydrolase [Coccidioides immitis H538.4]